MVISYLLLGAFEVENGAGQRVPIADSIAARILAYLAFHGRFCSRAEIIKGCWGSHKLDGRDKLEDEAYSRQISNLRLIFKNTLGLRWEDYLLTQPNGMQLKDGMFQTDVTRFQVLVNAGMDDSRPAAERIAQLREAEGLRRGYLLDGMHCEWIVSESGGARAAVEQRCAAVRRTITDLLRDDDAPAAVPMVPYYEGFKAWFPLLQELIAGARGEMICYGINFHISIPMLKRVLLDRLRAGTSVKILMLDPHGRWLDEMALATTNDPVTLRAEGVASLSGLADIRRAWESDCAARGVSNAPQQFEVRLFDGMVHGRIYAFDAEGADGKLLLFPYVHGISPSLLPGYLWLRQSDGPYQVYLHELRRLWDSAASPVPSPIPSGMSEAPGPGQGPQGEANP